MAQSNSERIGSALELLKEGLRPFIEDEMHAVYGDCWMQKAAVGLREHHLDQRRGKIHDGDIQVLLIVINEQWDAVFKNSLGYEELRLVKELRGIRSKWAHQESFSTEETYRALGSMQFLLTAISATQANEIKHQKEEVLRILVKEQDLLKPSKAADVPQQSPQEPQQEQAPLTPSKAVDTPQQPPQKSQQEQASLNSPQVPNQPLPQKPQQEPPPLKPPQAADVPQQSPQKPNQSSPYTSYNAGYPSQNSNTPGQYGSNYPPQTPTNSHGSQQSGSRQQSMHQQPDPQQPPYRPHNATYPPPFVSTFGASSMGLDPSTAAGLSYAFGWLTGIFFFFSSERQNHFVRFHAMQSIIFCGGVNLLLFILLSHYADLAGWIFFLGFIVWVMLMFNGFRGTYFKLPIIGDLAEKYAKPRTL